ncbi:DUF1684 domain-containing protein [Streptomyces sp. NP160]|uniref:DUF1684 domain-containing protein n=1 Tax=Streptomyces sp. NP160 TaxID=2586637 RepID=UPI001117ED04|nr:DUF1684 domain-containing protein [Streptomyces sp. NP160]TNM67341.1 DUF1684 domain-containing protein [Streptomyces sp. NP160]
MSHVDARAADWERWRAGREASVRSVPGNLALVAYQPLAADDAHVDVLAGGPAADVVVRRSEGGARFFLPEGVAELDGRPVSGEVDVALLGADGAPVLRLGRYAVDVFSLDGSDAELRIYDTQAPALDRFSGIETYPYDPEWVLPARWSPLPAVSAVPWGFSRASDSGHAKKVPGTLSADVEGQHLDLLAFLNGEALVLVFADGTTGAESYAPGRFLSLERPTGSEAVLDFNRAFVPPCGFSDWYSCPLPPAENRIQAPVRAGERRVLWRKR